MTSRTAQLARQIALVEADMPLADRWDLLTAQSEQLESIIDEARAAHRADCLQRYGRDIFGDGE